MKDIRKISRAQLAIMLADAMIMILTVALQLASFNLWRHIALCGIIILLTVVLIIFDILLKSKRDIINHVFWVLIWLINLVLHLYR